MTADYCESRWLPWNVPK